MLLIKFQHLHAFKLLITLRLLFDASEFWLHFFHSLRLVQLLFNEREQGKANKYCKDNEANAKITTRNNAIKANKHVKYWL